MAWRLQGTYFETCSCDFICPCTANLAHGATYDRCRVLLVFNVTDGEIEGIDVSGLKVAVFGDTPKVMTDGNWRLGVFLDSAASEDQAGKLLGVFGGQMGGPMAGLVPLVGEMLGVEHAPIEIHEEGLHHSVKIGDAVDLEIQDVVPFGVESGQPARLVGVFHPASSEFALATTTHSKLDMFGIEWVGNSALSASEFSWAA
jgi:hypothetical protein